MPAILLALIIPIIIGCASTVQQTEPIAECSSDEFRGFGVGENENEALAEAHSALARQINSSVNVTIERIVSQQISNGKENLNTGYESKTVIESALPNAHDARIARNKRNGNKTSVTVCMSKTDAAKGFLARQRLLEDSLSLASNTVVSTEHPKHKNEAWRKTQMLYNDFVRIQYLLDGWGVKSPYLANGIYSKSREDYRDYCGAAKLHWNPEKETPYSEITFSKLSNSIKIEKSPCNDRGISLTYKGSEPECSVKFGLNTCSYANSLSLNACDGTEYLQLKGDTMGAHQKPDFALEKLQSNFKSAEFWNQWLQEIKQWSPQCE
ncbi:MAG: hypothetical protein LBC87_12690 [Fibromonadaceae bacterium]|jgi:hypothetical protein|nr:hypothetical protein [Fibromonadaceae bacterium]